VGEGDQAGGRRAAVISTPRLRTGVLQGGCLNQEVSDFTVGVLASSGKKSLSREFFHQFVKHDAGEAGSITPGQ
jgi:hypothetical protein